MDEPRKKQIHIAGRTYKQWCDDNREHLREKHNGYYAKNMQDPDRAEQERARRRRWAQNHKDQVNAMQRVNAYIKKGLIARKPCEKCGSNDSQAHHDDYTRPLSVRWLCPMHHKEWHMHNAPKRGAVDKEKTKQDRDKIKAGLYK